MQHINELKFNTMQAKQNQRKKKTLTDRNKSKIDNFR